jgi:hypothetical protein
MSSLLNVFRSKEIETYGYYLSLRRETGSTKYHADLPD